MKKILSLSFAMILLCIGACNTETVQQNTEGNRNLCLYAVAHGWTLSGYGYQNMAQMCQNKLEEAEINISTHGLEDGINLCLHGGLPRLCWVEKESQDLIIWWTPHTNVRVAKADRPQVDPHVTWLKLDTPSDYR